MAIPRICMVLILVLISWPAGSAEAEEGIKRWFPCGISFWQECKPSPPSQPQPEQAPPEPSSPLPSGSASNEPANREKSIPQENLATWGTPVVGSSGEISYQLPPKPILDLFSSPGDDTARAYLAWMSEKTRGREEAFAAIRRVAGEMGYKTSLPQSPHEIAAGPLPPDLSHLSPELSLPSAAAAGFPNKLPLGATQRQGENRDKPPLPPPSDVLQAPTPIRYTASEQGSGSATNVAEGSGKTAPGQQVRIFYFFSPKCPYCEKETPIISEVTKGRSDVVGIAMDTTREELLEYVRRMRISFPVTIDREESKAFGITGYPAVVAIRRDGQPLRLSGLITREELLQLLGEI